MEAFDFAFTLFGLVLALAMAEVLGGFARVLKARASPARATGATTGDARPASLRSTGEAGSSAAIGQHIHVGWLTPGIAVAVLLGLIGTWILAWNARAGIPITFATLIAGTAVAGVYIAAKQTKGKKIPSDTLPRCQTTDKVRGKAKPIGQICIDGRRVDQTCP